MNTLDLKKIDFSENDAEVYLALIQHKETLVGPLISETGLHRNIVYTALEHLVQRKLVSEKTINGKKHFAVTSPSLLVEEYTQKAKTAESIAEQIRAKMNAGEQEITVHQGNDEYLKLLSSLIKSLPSGSTKYVLGTGGEDFMETTMRPIWKKYHQVAIEQKLHIKMLGYESQRASLKDIADQKRTPDIYEVRYIQSDIENPAGLHVYPEINTVLNIIYSNKTEPVTAIKIVNKALTQSYLNFFENFWKTAKN